MKTKLKISSPLPNRKTLHGLVAIRVENKKGEWILDAIGNDEKEARSNAKKIIKQTNMHQYLIAELSLALPYVMDRQKERIKKLIKQAEQKQTLPNHA